MHAARSLGRWKFRILPVFCHNCGVILGPDILAGPFSPDAPYPASFIALYSFLVDGFQHSINTPIWFWLGELATGGCFWPGFFCCHCHETLVVSLSKCPALGTLLAVEKQRCGLWLLRTSFTQFWIYEVADEVTSAFLTRWHCTVRHHKRIGDFAWMQVEICRNTARISAPCPEIEFRKEKFDPRPPFCTPGVHSFSQRE